MGFIEKAVDGQFQLTLDRIRQKLDYGYENQQPDLDVKQQRDFLTALGQGKTDEPYRQCLEYHGFRFYALEDIVRSGLPGTLTKTEGEWRNGKLKMAFTPTDLTTGFPAGPESLDRYLREQKMEAVVQRGKMSKQALRQVRQRK